MPVCRLVCLPAGRFSRSPLTLLVAIACMASTVSVQAVGFVPVDSAWSAQPGLAIEVGDGDGDGHDDIAVAEPIAGDISVLWSRGGGASRFEPAQSMAFPIAPHRLAFADLNNDGLADLVAVGDSRESRLVVRLALAGRGFAPAVSYVLPAGTPPGSRQVIASDLDRDGDRDLVVADLESLTVLVGRGDGTFDPPRLEGRPGYEIWRLQAVRLNADLAIDVLVSRGSELESWLNDGSGRLVPGIVLASGSGVPDAVALDLNGDGAADVASVEPGRVRIFTNNGGGSFSAGPTLVTASTATASRAVDVNGDGRGDLVVSDVNATLSVLYGDGAGGLLAPVVRALPSGPSLLALGDFNADGDPGDVAALCSTREIVTQVSAGTPVVASPWASYPTGDDPRALAIADFDGDGIADVVAADRGGRDLTVLLGTGGGTLAATGRASTEGFPIAVVAADLDGDGLKDLLATSVGEPPSVSGATSAAGVGRLEFLRNVGGGVFAPPSTLAAGLGPTGLAAGELNGDGWVDIAVTSGGTGELLLFGNFGGALGLPTRLAAGQGPVGVVMADLDGDGDLDLATTGPGHVLAFRNDGVGGSWPATETLAAGQGPVAITALDLDLDGRSDLAVLDAVTREASLLRAGAALEFVLSDVVAVPGVPSAIATGDLNCDAAEDLLIASDTGDEQSVLAVLSEGNGRVAPPLWLAAGQGPTAVAAGNLDGVGSDDPVVATGQRDQLRVGLNQACQEPACSAPAPPIGGEVSGCSRQTLSIDGPPGFARYRWSNGDEGQRIRLPLPVAGSMTVGLLALDASGCAAGGEYAVNVLPVPDITLVSDRLHGCAESSASVSFSLSAVTSEGGPPSASGFDWEVDPPGLLAAAGASLNVVTFPARTPAGRYEVRVRAWSESGCARVSARELKLMLDPAAPSPVGNSLWLRRAGGQAVELLWTATSASIYAVERGLAKAPEASPLELVERGIEGNHVIDSVVTGTWFYRVRPDLVCEGSSAQ